MCHVLHYSCNVNAAVADSLCCRYELQNSSVFSARFNAPSDELQNRRFLKPVFS